MNLSSITGVLLVVGAVIWLGVFIPNWVKRGHEVEETRQTRERVRHQVLEALPMPQQTKQVNTARSAMRLGNIRRALGVASLAGAFVGIFALTDIARFGGLAGGAFTLAGVSILVNRVMGTKQRALLEASVQGRSQRAKNYRAMYQTAINLELAKGQIEDRSWTPRELPAPMHVGHVGSLEQPTLAQVTELPVNQSRTSETRPEEQIAGANLDEILRRRRAI